MYRRFCLFPIFTALLLYASITLAQPLTGTKTIGGTSPDYPTIHAAIDSLNTRGVGTGGVNFRIRNGTYTGSALTITLRLDVNHQVFFGIDSGATVLINAATTILDTGLLNLNCDYVKFDGSWNGDEHGRHLTISGNAPLVLLWLQDASHITIKNCVINDVDTNYQGYGCVIFTQTRTLQHVYSNRNDYLLDCDIVGGNMGIWISDWGTENSMNDSIFIRFCNVMNFSNVGIKPERCINSDFSNNHIFNTNIMLHPFAGMYLGEVANTLVSSNKIGPWTSTASELIGINLMTVSNNLFSNNMIVSNEDFSLNKYGILYLGSNGGNKFLFNTISLSGSSNDSACSYAFFCDQLISDTLWGNAFQNICTGGFGNFYHHLVLYGTGIPQATSHFYSNFNVLSTGSNDSTDNRFVAAFYNDSTNALDYFRTIEDLHTSSWFPNDANSFSELVPFVSDSNLHIRTNIPTRIESGAPHHWQVLTDFDGDTRSSPMCDIGADEGNFIPLSVRNASFELPTEFSLTSIYPNPFNSTTTIRFTLPMSAKTNIEVFDITGREVAKLVDGAHNAGSHNVRFDGSKLASGIYFVRMTVGNFTAQQKMVLLK